MDTVLTETELVNVLTTLNAMEIRLLESIAVILAIWLLKTIILKIAFRKVTDLTDRYRWQKTAWYSAAALGVLLVGRIWFEGIHSLATFLGLLTAGIAIALRDPLVNIAGWLYIVSRRPFHVGDRIEVGDDAGDIVDLGMFHFAIMEIGKWVDADQNTGRIVYIPNGVVFSTPIGNFSEGWFEYIWTEIIVRISFESNWPKAKRILNDISMKHGKALSSAAQRKVRATTGRYMVIQSSVRPTAYTSVKDNGIQLATRYLCDPRRRRNSEQAVWEDILTEFAKHDDIQFAYPTQRFFNNAQEGKSGARSAFTGSEDQTGESDKTPSAASSKKPPAGN